MTFGSSAGRREPGTAFGMGRTGANARTYRMGKGWRLFLGVAGIGFAAAAVASFLSLRQEPGPGWLIAPAVFGFFAALSLLAMEQMRRMRFTIDDAGIEVIEWSRPRRLLLEQLAGYRTLQGGKGGASLLLEPRQPGARSLKVPLLKEMAGPEFQAWLSRLTDLDARDRARSESEMLASPALGGTPAERAASLAAAKKIANALNAAALLVGFWVLLFPRPYGLAVGAAYALPVAALAVAALGRGRYQLLGSRNDARPQVGLPLFMPGLCAIPRAFDFELVAPSGLLVPAVVTGLVLGVVVLVADPVVRRRPAWLLLLLPFLIGQAAGAATVANCYRDPSAPAVQEVEVLGHRVSRGKSTTYYLRLARWGPRAGPEDVSVPRDLYRAVEDFQTVRVELRAGRLGLAWFRVRA
jgi:hypothetical protein